MSEKAAGAAEVQDLGLRAGVGRKARPKIGTEFRGVSGRHGGKFAARIRGSKGQSQTWLGTFDTAEDAARAFDAAAAKMRGAAARTNFKQAATIDDGGVSPPLQVPAEPSGCRDTGANFRGVWRTRSGKFGARIRHYKGKTHAWLGSFNTAEDAAMAYDAAAVELHGARAITNFKQPAAIDDGGVLPLLQVQAEPFCGRDTRTNFRGVCSTRSGKFRARIRQYKGKSQTWLGTFDAAEDAAMAYDAAAVELHGARAITNFKQPAAIDDDGVSPLVAEPSGHGVHTAPQICDWKGKAALSLGGFRSPGMRHDDLPVDLPPAEWQQVDDLLKDMDSIEDREALMEGAAILHHISLADMEMVGEANQHNW